MTTGASPKLEVADPGRRSSRAGSGLMFVLLLILLIFNILRFFVGAPDGGLHASGDVAAMPVQQLKEVALELENHNIHGPAADRWEEYLEQAHLVGVEAGRIRYYVGKNRQQAGDYARAFDQYVLAEKLLGGDEPNLEDEIAQRRMECLRRLGQYSDLTREIGNRARGAEGASLEGQQVVAVIDGRKMTVADFDRLLTQEIDLAVRSRMGLSREEEDAQRRRAHEQFGEPEIRARELERIVVARVLSKEARQRKLHQSDAFLERMASVSDSLLSSTLMAEEMKARATVTDEDVERFYVANREHYEQPPVSFIAHVQVQSEDQAKELLVRIAQGASFDDLVKRESLDKTTANKMGILATPVLADGEQVPLFGANAMLHDAIRAGEAASVLPEPWQSPRGWHVIKIVSHRPKVTPPLDEIRQTVLRDTTLTRQREVSRQYIDELFQKYEVKVYPNAFSRDADEGESEES